MNSKRQFSQPKLADEGIEKHLIRLGVDYDLFVKLADRNTAIGTMCRILQKDDMPKPWAWETMRGWVRQYAAEKEKE